ncbi:uncharacterized protein [Medicago truncatula]|uniref:uncharacterized protein isoform X1 n=1 Tax=Medicago truncatula TaxID=3880 RepID=UPI0002367A11|nr:uncharacterized protein LOC11445149 isoform X1 [Medicago truncatula]
MDFEVKLSPTLIFFKPYSSHAHGNLEVKCCTQSQSKETTSSVQIKKQCLRCNTLYSDQQNSPVSCSFHGHTNGDKGLFSYYPPHQGIDGYWKWNEKNNRPSIGRVNWEKIWSCWAE